MQKKKNSFEAKIWERWDHNRKAKGLNNEENCYMDSKKDAKKYQIGKHQAMMEYMDSYFKNSLQSMIDWKW